MEGSGRCAASSGPRPHKPALMLPPRLDRRCLPSQLGKSHSFTPAWEVAEALELALGKDTGGDRVNKCLLVLVSAPAWPRKHFGFPVGLVLLPSPPLIHSINLNPGYFLLHTGSVVDLRPQKNKTRSLPWGTPN